MTRNGHNAEVVKPRTPSIDDERIPEIVKRGMGHACLAARPFKGMRDARDVIVRVHVLRVCLPSIHLGWVDKHPGTTHVSCSSFQRACQRLAQRDETPFIGLGIRGFQANGAELQVHLIPA